MAGPIAYIIIGTLLFSGAARASNWRVSKDRNELAHAIEVTKGGKHIMSFSPPPFLRLTLDDFLLIEPEETGPFLVTVWNKGNHGSNALIFDLALAGRGIPTERAVVYSYNSAWEIELAEEDEAQGLTIVGKSFEMDPESLEYKRETVVCRLRYTKTRQLDCREKAAKKPCKYSGKMSG